MLITFCNEQLPKSASQNCSNLGSGTHEQAETGEMTEHNSPAINATVVKHGKVSPRIVAVLQIVIINISINESHQCTFNPPPISQ